MAEWVPVTDEFIEADVIRWREGVFSRPKRRGTRALNIGTRVVTAEVLQDEDEKGLVVLLIRGCEVLTEKFIGKTVEVLRKSNKVRRARKTIMQGKPERLIWSDETARDIVASRFLGNRKPTSLTPTKGRAKGRPVRARPSRSGYGPGRAGS